MGSSPGQASPDPLRKQIPLELCEYADQAEQHSPASRACIDCLPVGKQVNPCAGQAVHDCQKLTDGPRKPTKRPDGNKVNLTANDALEQFGEAWAGFPTLGAAHCIRKAVDNLPVGSLGHVTEVAKLVLSRLTRC